MTRCTAAFVAACLCALPAMAGSDACIELDAYTGQGGTLEPVANVDLTGLDKDLPSFFCDRVPCGGSVGLRGIVREDGSVGDLAIINNNWQDRPAEHASVIRARLAAMRYAPPKLNGRPVCVRMQWQIALMFGGAKNTP